MMRRAILRLPSTAPTWSPRGYSASLGRTAGRDAGVGVRVWRQGANHQKDMYGQQQGAVSAEGKPSIDRVVLKRSARRCMGWKSLGIRPPAEVGGAEDLEIPDCLEPPCLGLA